MTAPMAAKTCVRLGTPHPAPPLPWKEISVDRLLPIGGGKKAPGSSPAAWYSEGVGLGRREPVLPSCSPSHAPPHGASRSRRAFGAKGRGRCPGACLALGTGRGSPGSVACGVGAALRPPLLPPSPLPSRRSGWVSGGRVPIMNEQSRGRRGEEPRARPPACARSRRVPGAQRGRRGTPEGRSGGRAPRGAPGRALLPTFLRARGDAGRGLPRLPGPGRTNPR